MVMIFEILMFRYFIITNNFYYFFVNTHYMSRPSPSESATVHDEYTMRMGNDKNIWCNVKINGILKWIKIYALDSKKSTYIINFKLLDKISQLFLNKNQKQFELIEELPIEKHLVIGDSTVNKLIDFKASMYYIYRFNHSLVASEKKLTHEKILNDDFFIKTFVGCDIATFAYYDMATIDKFRNYLLNTLKTTVKEKKNNSNLKKRLSLLTKEVNKKIYHTTFQIQYNKKLADKKTHTTIFKSEDMPFEKETDVKDTLPSEIVKSKIMKQDYIKNVFGENKVIIVSGDNFFGDGEFPVVSNTKKTICIQLGASHYYVMGAIFEVFKNNISIEIPELLKHKK